MKKETVVILLFTGLVLLLGIKGFAAEENIPPASGENGEYRIEQPGTITFTVGVKISGKVEKPQVMIFLPKEKTLYRDEKLTRSFSKEIEQPLPFTAIIE